MANRGRIIYHFLRYRYLHRFRDRTALESFQRRKLKALKMHLIKYSSYFQEQLSGGQGFKKLPYMDKETMMTHFDEMVCVPLKKEKAMAMALDSERSRDFSETLNGISVGLSSGTSGHRGLFLVSQEEADLWTGAIMARMLPKIKGRIEIAFFLRANSNLYENAGTGRIGFKYYDIYRDMNHHIEGLNRQQPHLLIAPPSVLSVLCDWVEEGILTIQPVKVISVAEVLEASDAKRFKGCFNQEVIHQVYQCTEGFIACTCEHGTLHVNEDIVQMEKEWLDEDRFVPVITDFTRRSQPIVRYRLNDVLRVKKDVCSCGSPFLALESIEGREDDVFYLSDGHGGQVTVYSDVIRRSMLYVAGIKHYQVILEDQGSVTVKLTYESDAEPKEVQRCINREFEGMAEQFGFVLPVLSFEPYVHQLDRKMKRVLRR